jgi:hypothetical protein
LLFNNEIALLRPLVLAIAREESHRGKSLAHTLAFDLPGRMAPVSFFAEFVIL